MEKQPKKKTIIRLIIIAIVLLLLMIGATILLMPCIRRLGNPVTQEKLRNWLGSLGIWGFLLVLAVQMAQIIIAVIPGEPVEILAGVMYGGFGGLCICLLGCVIASAAVFLLSKKFGAVIARRYYKKENISEFSFMKNVRNLEVVVFILFLIPGTPKDLLTYVAGTTPMKLVQFLVISTFARIPSIVTSTFLGSSLWNENWIVSVSLFAFIAVTGILGIVYRDRIIHFYKRNNAHTKEDIQNKTE